MFSKNNLKDCISFKISTMTLVLNNNCLNAFKDRTTEMCIKKGWHKASIEQVWLYLIEEIGELAGSIRRSKNQFKDEKRIKLEDEMGDVFSYLFQIAGMLDIDLDAMWIKNQSKAYKKMYIKC